MTGTTNGLPCAIECMCFNETAHEIADLIREICKPAELNGEINVIMTTDDLADMSIGDFNNPIICEEGWSLT